MYIRQRKHVWRWIYRWSYRNATSLIPPRLKSPKCCVCVMARSCTLRKTLRVKKVCSLRCKLIPTVCRTCRLFEGFDKTIHKCSAQTAVLWWLSPISIRQSAVLNQLRSVLIFSGKKQGRHAANVSGPISSLYPDWELPVNMAWRHHPMWMPVHQTVLQNLNVEEQEDELNPRRQSGKQVLLFKAMSFPCVHPLIWVWVRLTVCSDIAVRAASFSWDPQSKQDLLGSLFSSREAAVRPQSWWVQTLIAPANRTEGHRPVKLAEVHHQQKAGHHAVLCAARPRDSDHENRDNSWWQDNPTPARNVLDLQLRVQTQILMCYKKTSSCSATPCSHFHKTITSHKAQWKVQMRSNFKHKHIYV